jgi:hypothetical protein
VTPTPIGFGAAQGGGLLVYDGGWRKLEADHAAAPQAPQRSALEGPGILSPDGRLLAVWKPPRLSIADPTTSKVLRSWSLGGKLQAIDWSGDARRLVTVVTHFRDRTKRYLPLMNSPYSRREERRRLTPRSSEAASRRGASRGFRGGGPLNARTLGSIGFLG